MKKILMLAASALCLMACNKDLTDKSDNSFIPAQRATLKVAVCGHGVPTKADEVQTADEAAVKTLQVFVFNGDQIDVYGSVANAKSLTLDATTGDRSIWALVNAPDLKTTKTLTALKAAVSKFSDNAADSFVMVGHVDETLTAQSEVSISVDRIAARVVVGKITRKMSASGIAALPADSFEFVRAYLADAVSEQNYAGTLTQYSAWMSSTLGDGEILKSNAMVYHKLDEAQAIAQDGTFDYSHSFYCYPNATTEDAQDARVTRMVIECKIDGAFYAFPILLSMGVQSNKSYEIRELILTRLGNPTDGDDTIEDSETAPIVSVEIPFGVEVNDWDVVLIGNEGTVTI